MTAGRGFIALVAVLLGPAFLGEDMSVRTIAGGVLILAGVAIVLDRYWNILLANEGTGRFMGLFLDSEDAAALGSPNAMRLIFHSQALRPYIVNWEATAAAFTTAAAQLGLADDGR